MKKFRVLIHMFSADWGSSVEVIETEAESREELWTQVNAAWPSDIFAIDIEEIEQ